MDFLTDILLRLATSGEKLGDGTVSPPSIDTEGIGWGWAFALATALATAVVWSYLRYAPALSRPRRIFLATLRSLLLALLVLMLVKPVLRVVVDETTRRPLAVLLDLSQSMALEDRRDTPADIARADIALGSLAPDAPLPAANAAVTAAVSLSRAKLLTGLADNARLDLWARLAKRSDIEFHGFGRDARPLAAFNAQSTRADFAAFFNGLKHTENATDLGGSLRRVLDEKRGQSPAGVLVITDGASNTGPSPATAAETARRDGTPLFLYGVGVANPRYLMVREVKGPASVAVKEKAVFTVRVKTRNMAGQRVEVRLTANGRVVETQPLEIRSDGEQELTLSHVPETAGELVIEAAIPQAAATATAATADAAAGAAATRPTAGLSAKTRLFVTNDKIKILLVQQEPNWDFQYLLALARRDRRLDVKAVLLKGDADLASEPDSPFLAAVPNTKEDLFKYDVIVLADADPALLGAQRIEWLREWVDKAGGGLALVAGEKFLPQAYATTPLDALFPIEPAQTKVSRTHDTPAPLTLTPAGETSPLTALADLPDANREQWKQLPAIPWTAWVGAARPGVQVLLTDPTPARKPALGAAGMPVLATRNFGMGQILYVGTHQTHRWRSKTGEKFFARLWGQFFQTLSNQKLSNNKLTQLRADKTAYTVGEPVLIDGRLFKAEGFEPFTDAEVPAILTVRAPDGKAHTSEVRLQSQPDRPGHYSAKLTATAVGKHSFHTLRDAANIVTFDVEASDAETADIAMNAAQLREMAEISGGRFLREEDLDKLPNMLLARDSSNAFVRTIPLNFTPWLFALLLLLAATEWVLRRKLDLK
ncbi:MAG: VWA domain-containing protein [Puniceicoccales bacterium]|jgi:hypothetical protein|nr:VWA domain-containing protein [Puniceicoccales bacterium]